MKKTLDQKILILLPILILFFAFVVGPIIRAYKKAVIVHKTSAISENQIPSNKK